METSHCFVSLSELLYDPKEDAKYVHKGRDLAFSRLVRSKKCFPTTEAVEQKTIVATYLRYINFSIQKQVEDIFGFYSNSESYDKLWKVFCNELERVVCLI